MTKTENSEWALTEVKSPHIANPVQVIAAKNIPYRPNANRFQNFNIYLPYNAETSGRVGSNVNLLPALARTKRPAFWHVHVHGGAWRDPNLTSTSIEAAVAHAFSNHDNEAQAQISAIISINYTLSPFPTHPTVPYDPEKGDHADPAREAAHPKHVQDVLHAFSSLRRLGLTDGSYILSGHSAGSCLVFQSILQPPEHWGLDAAYEVPRPAALLGMNGLYDLPDLVDGLGASHVHLKDVYLNLISIAFGSDQTTWGAASPARVNKDVLKQRVSNGKIPTLIVLDQSEQDQLVPMNQTERLERHLSDVQGLQVIRGYRCTGVHAAPWEEGIMIWQSIQDILKLLAMR